MKKIILGLIFIFILTSLQGQTINVLFLGNSYTASNNLPQLVADMATSTGDTLIFDSNLMGGATFNAHSLNTVSLNKIMLGNWDYVVLQGQSLELWGNFTNILASFPQVVVLDSLINHYSPCGETMFFRTWGRKNGFGATSYQTLDSIIHINYMKLADSLDAVVSPAGVVWKYIRQQHPTIELYATDESHPSPAGSYAAACSFYTALFRKDPTYITFNAGLTASVATQIRDAAKLVVYDSLLNWHITEYDSIINLNCNTVGISESNDSQLIVYPNPTTGILNFNYQDHSYSELIIYDILLRKIKSVEITSLATIDVSYLDAGVYNYIILSKSEIIAKGKFIKQNP